MSIITSTFVATVANHILEESIKDGAYGVVKRIFHFIFLNATYKNALQDTIVNTVTVYRTKFPTADGKVAFYELEEVYNYLNTYVFFGKGQAQQIREFLSRYPDLDLPTEEQLIQFFDYFYNNVKNNKKLKKLYIAENYQEHIFEIGKQFARIEKKVDQILDLLDGGHVLSLDGYIKRNTEQKLLDQLESESVLLLTGMSFCGKTQLAKYLCRNYVDRGFNFQEFNAIDTCIDKIRRSGWEKGIILLDDPFGHVDKNVNSQNDWAKLNNLLRDFPKNLKLIVCSRLDIIYSVNNDGRLECCNIGSHQWIDLTVKDAQFIHGYWKEVSKNQFMDNGFIERFGTYLSTNFEQDKLQPGQLDYLIHMPFDEIKDKSNVELVYLAQADSKQISDVIVNDSSLTRIYIALGFSCDTINFVSFKELAYILSSSEKLLGYSIGYQSKSNKIENGKNGYNHC